MLTYFVTTVVAGGSAWLADQAARDGRTYSSQAPDDGGSQRRRKGRLWAFVAGATLALVAGLRWRVGTDYGQYALNYDLYKSQSLEWENEPGIRVIARFSAFVYDDSATFLAIAAVVTVALTTWTIFRNSEAFAAAIVLYIVTMSWQGSFNGVRQYLACAVLFAAHRLIIERRVLLFAGAVGLASLFHVSALAGMLLYWVPRRPLGGLRSLALLALAAAAVLSYDQVGALVDNVTQEDIASSNYFVEQLNPLRVALAFFPVLLYWLFTDRARLDSTDYFYVNLAFVNAAVFASSFGSAYVARFGIYTSIYLTLAIPAILRLRDENLRGLGVVLVSIVYFVFWYLETTTASTLAQFRWIFDRTGP